MIDEGGLLWEASRERREASNITHFIKWLGERGQHFSDYEDLWQWSVSDLEGFWTAIWDYFEIRAEGELDAVVTNDAMPARDGLREPG